VNVEALVTAAGQNVKRLLTFWGRGPRRLAQAQALRLPAPTSPRRSAPSMSHRIGDPSASLARFSTRWVFSEIRKQGVLTSSLPAREKLRKRLSSPLKFIADSLPPTIVRHEKGRRGIRKRKGGRRQLKRQVLGSKGQSPAFR
jgi:hypothetical protein